MICSSTFSSRKHAVACPPILQSVRLVYRHSSDDIASRDLQMPWPSSHWWILYGHALIKRSTGGPFSPQPPLPTKFPGLAEWLRATRRSWRGPWQAWGRLKDGHLASISVKSHPIPDMRHGSRHLPEKRLQMTLSNARHQAPQTSLTGYPLVSRVPRFRAHCAIQFSVHVGLRRTTHHRPRGAGRKALATTASCFHMSSLLELR